MNKKMNEQINVETDKLEIANYVYKPRVVKLP